MRTSTTCLRAWQAGYEVAYVPSARLYHHESATRGTEQGDRELASQRVFWERWAAFFGDRPVLTDDGRLRVVYVTEGTIVGGGHRDVFEHLNGLADRGHDVALWTLEGPPDWFALRCPVRTFTDYDELAAALAPLDAIKVATWWNTATPVWRASVVHGIPVVLCPGHRDQLLPGRPRAPPRGAQHVSSGVPLPHDLRVEPRPSLELGLHAELSHREWTWRRFTRWPQRRGATTWCWRWAAPTRSRTYPSPSTPGVASTSRDPSCACSAHVPSWRPTRGSAM